MPDRAGPAHLAVNGDIATLTLNRPKSYNAINEEMASCLLALTREVEAADGVKVLVVRGEGSAFCGGGDIRHFLQNLDNIGPCIRALLSPYHEFLLALRRMPQLVVASVHGSAAGAGLSLVTMCDLCIAAEDAIFTPAYAAIGVSPDGGGTWGLTRAVGERRAIQIYLSERSFTAQQAAEWGVVNQLTGADTLEDETVRYAARIARTSPDAIAGTKRLVHQSRTRDLTCHLEDEMETLIGCMASETFVTAINKFVQKG